MEISAFHLLPVKTRSSLTWNQIVNILGYQPPLHDVQRYLEKRGFYLCNGQTFRKASDLVRKSGRPPSRDEMGKTNCGARPFYKIVGR